MPRAASAMVKVSMPLARRSPTNAMDAEMKSRATGLTPSLCSMKWAQNRSPNMMAEV